MNEGEKLQNTAKTIKVTDESMLTPVNDINSGCYQCDAGMCHICSSKSNWGGVNECVEQIIDDKPKFEPMTVKKNILWCYMCGWEHHSPNEWNDYEKATNGTLQKCCGRCGRISLLEKTIIQT